MILNHTRTLQLLSETKKRKESNIALHNKPKAKASYSKIGRLQIMQRSYCEKKINEDKVKIKVSTLLEKPFNNSSKDSVQRLTFFTTMTNRYLANKATDSH